MYIISRALSRTVVCRQANNTQQKTISKNVSNSQYEHMTLYQ